MMDDQERSMHASDGGADVGADTDETYARAALGAHPWPRFGEALKARLMAIPTTAPQASSGASRESRRTPTHDTGPQSVPRDARRRRREAWAMAVVVAVVAGLAIALAGTARVRQGRPVERPVGIGVATAAAGMITDVLSGRLIYHTQEQEGDPFTMRSLNMRDGTTQRLWTGPAITSTDMLWSVSPDGTRVALVRNDSIDEGEGTIYIRALTKDAPEATLAVKSSLVAGLEWAQDGRALYYGRPTVATPVTDTDVSLVAWELHRLALVGPSVPNVDVGEDQTIARFEATDLNHAGWAELIGVDDHDRAAVSTMAHDDADNLSGEIVLVDLVSGKIVDRAKSVGIAVGLNHVSSPSGAAVAFWSCALCEDRDPTTMQVVDLQSVSARTVYTGVASDIQTPGLWSPDGRWLVWQRDSDSGPIRAFDLAATPANVVVVEDSLGSAIRFAPGSAVLLTSAGQLIDLDAAARGQPATKFVPWPTPEGFAWPGSSGGDVTTILDWVADAPIRAKSPKAAPGPFHTDAPILIMPNGLRKTKLGPTVTPIHADEQDATDLITPVATVVAAASAADPSAAPLLDIGEWSPDSRWLPFWTAEHDDWMNPSDEAARLYFYDATTGSTCAQPGVQRRSRSDTVGWADDGQAIVRVDAVPAVGAPCRSLVPAPDSPLALPTARAGETPSWANVWSGDGPVDAAGDESSGTSPDGTYVVTTRTLDDTPRYRTSISRADDGSLTGEALWTGSGGFGGAGIGGTWMPDNGFLIPSSTDKGPMIIKPNGDVTNVATDLFYMPATVGDVGKRIAWLVASPDGPDGHLFLTGVGGVQLYHPEIQVPEALPSAELWGLGVSGDGRWLTLHGREGETGPPMGLWIRGIEDSGEPFRLIPESQHSDMRFAPVSTSGHRIAFGDYEAGTFAVVTFPEGVVVGRWRLDGHRFGSAYWSPDGRTVAIHGYQYDSNSTMIGRALFIVPLPPEP